MTRMFTLIALAYILAACGGSPRHVPPEKVSFGGENVLVERTTGDVPVFILDVYLEEGDPPAHLNTEEDAISTQEESPTLEGYVARSWTFDKTFEDGRRIGYLFVNWDDDNPHDFLAAGWWANTLREGTGDPELTVNFIDGPEFDPSNPPQLPVSGTAKYMGEANGMHYYVARNAYSTIVNIGEFAGTAEMTVDFADKSLSGCIGCDGSMRIGTKYIGDLLEGPYSGVPRANPEGYAVHFGSADIREDGTWYTEDNISVTHPMREPMTTDAYAGGELSNRPNADGVPRLISNQFSVQFREPATGSTGAFTGGFVAKPE